MKGVELVTPEPHLSPLAGLHLVNGKLVHGSGEIHEEGGLVGGVHLHNWPRPRVGAHQVISSEEAQPIQNVLVIGVVKLARRPDVIKGSNAVINSVVMA